jgi:hypothetical protein
MIDSDIGVMDQGLDLDSHADMAVLGSNCVVFEETGKTIDVIRMTQRWGAVSAKLCLVLLHTMTQGLGK